jgi:protein-disulfide isomerase
MRSLALVAGAALYTASCASASQSPSSPAASTGMGGTPTDIVATVAGEPITLADVDARAMQHPASDYGSARLAQAIFLARQSVLDELVGDRLLDLEAKARGVGRDALVQKEITGTVTPPTDADIQFWYQANPNAVQGRPLDTLKEPIKSLLLEQRLTQAQTKFIDALKAKNHVTLSLAPPRQTVAVAGHQSKGPATAPIEIVEFSDFQCPFCRSAFPTVQQVLAKYGDQVHFVYRHFPLSIHPDAVPAAEAAACAAKQGKFWPYHDRLFSSAPKLSDADLKADAAALGLDMTAFGACVDGHQTKAEVDQDMKDGEALGVTGTPAFFVNGRSLEGAQPLSAFVALIDEELALRK